MDIDTLKYVENSDYNSFSRDIKSEISQKLLNNPIIKEYNRRMNYYSDVSKRYNSISDLDDFKG